MIGNETYPQLHTSLPNTAANAKDMGDALAAAGFETTIKTNVSRRELYQLIDAFGAQIAATPNTVGLFYFAGEWVQANGKNYLIPVDGAIDDEGDLEAEAVDADKVLRAMDEAHNNVNIVLLDACRDNPLPKKRSLSRGLAGMKAAAGTFIGLAAAPGQATSTGDDGGNGSFTKALAEQIRHSPVPIEDMFKRVISGVESDTAGKQIPWMESSLQGDFYFTQPAAQAPAPTAVDVQPQPQPQQPQYIPAPGADREAMFWDSIKNSTDPADFEDFIHRYPDSEFASIAKRRMASLGGAATRSAAPSVPAASPGPLAAATPPPAPDAASGATAAPVPPVDQQEIARSLQTELQRVGCYSGTIDGVLGDGTANAIRHFNQQTGKHLDPQTASADAVATVHERTDKVCVVVPAANHPRPRRENDDVYYQSPPRPAAPAPTRQCYSVLGLVVLCP